MPFNGRDTNWPHKSKFQDSKLHNNSVEKHAYQSIKHGEFFMELIVRFFFIFLKSFSPTYFTFIENKSLCFVCTQVSMFRAIALSNFTACNHFFSFYELIIRVF